MLRRLVGKVILRLQYFLLDLVQDGLGYPSKRTACLLFSFSLGVLSLCSQRILPFSRVHLQWFAGTKYYVDYDDGDNGNSGLDSDHPKQTVPTLSTGDTVVFKRGVVYVSTYTTTVSGCTFTVESDWGTGQAIWGNNSMTNEWLLLIRHSGTVVTGLSSSKELLFTGTGLDRGAIAIFPSLGDISGDEVHYCEFANIGQNGKTEGIGVKVGVGDYDNDTTDFVLSNCSMHECWSYGIKISGGAGAMSGLVHHNSVHDNCARRQYDSVSDTNINISSNETTSMDLEVYENEIYDPAYSNCFNITVNLAGVKLYKNTIYGATSAGVKTDITYGIISGACEIYQNIIYGNGAEGILVGSGSATEYTKIYNNLIYNNSASAYNIRFMDGGHYTQVYHNTIYSNNGCGGVWSYGTATYSDIRDNIISVNGYYCIRYGTDTGATEDYNVLDARSGATGTINGKSAGAHDVIDDPELTSPPSDMTIGSSSPAKDAGADVGISTDYLGYARPYNSIYDIGAYEYGASGDTQVSVTVDLLTGFATQHDPSVSGGDIFRIYFRQGIRMRF